MHIKPDFILAILLLQLSVACHSGGTKPEDTTVIIDSIAESIDTVYTGTPPSEEPAKSDSPFYSLGCCDDLEKRINDCCCLEVLKKYEKMRKANDPRIATLKQNDVILSNCINSKKYYKKFDAIDNPEGDDDF
ncbi:MAG: hypothetical protein ABI761_06560 [Saprospiraceae bacterium]